MIKCRFPRIITVMLLLPKVFRQRGANSADPDQMSHYTLCVQGLHCFTLTQQCLDKSVGFVMNGLVKKIGQVLLRIMWYPGFVFETIAFRVMFEKV